MAWAMVLGVTDGSGDQAAVELTCRVQYGGDGVERSEAVLVGVTVPTSAGAAGIRPAVVAAVRAYAAARGWAVADAAVLLPVWQRGSG